MCGVGAEAAPIVDGSINPDGERRVFPRPYCVRARADLCVSTLRLHLSLASVPQDLNWLKASNSQFTTMAAATTVPVTFTYRSSSANTVEVAGNWDQWTGRIPLSKVAGVLEQDPDLWQVTHQVAPSTKITYKYILNGENWHTRDDVPTEIDANGCKNNLFQSPEHGHAASDGQQSKSASELSEQQYS